MGCHFIFKFVVIYLHTCKEEQIHSVLWQSLSALKIETALQPQVLETVIDNFF